MNRIAGRARITLLIAMLLVAGLAFFIGEYFTRASDWVIHPGSPHVYNGSNIGCGIVTDSEGVLLVNMNGGWVYSENEALRKATVHWVGDRQGSVDAPALSVYASELIAGFSQANGLYSYGQTGAIAKLTLSARVQAAALEALGDYKGTVGVYNYKTGQLICAVSTPTYDPDNIPDLDGDLTGAYEGMYLNRFTQSVYIPGSIFKIVTLAAALDSIPDIREQTFVCQGSYQMGKNDEITCEGIHGEQDLKQAFCNSCNCAFAQISEQLGKETLTRYVEQFGITQSVCFDGITTAPGNFDLKDASYFSAAWASIGQHTDQVNPCQFMTLLGAIANDGVGAKPYLVESIASGDVTAYAAETQMGDRIMSAATAEILQEYLLNNVQTKYGAENFPGFTVCAKTGTGEVGGDKKPNAMLTGFVADEEYPLAFIVAVEDAGYGKTVCVPILSKVLASCKTAIDAQ